MVSSGMPTTCYAEGQRYALTIYFGSMQGREMHLREIREALVKEGER